MNNIELVEHTQVLTMLDCTLNLISDQAIEIVTDVLDEQQYQALVLAMAVIEELSETLQTKIEKEGKV
jgi:hypothetical protein